MLRRCLPISVLLDPICRRSRAQAQPAGEENEIQKV
jgi:hypothetical protein